MSIKLDFARTASFDVDAQKTFTELCPNELPVPGGKSIVAALNDQAHYAQYRIGSKEAHHPSANWVNQPGMPRSVLENTHEFSWPVHAVPGTLGFEALDGLPLPTEYNYFVWKGIELNLHPYGACYHDLTERLSTGVIEFLHTHEITTVLVGGLALDYCVKVTALQLHKAGFDVIVNLDATRALTEEAKIETLALFKLKGIKVIASTAELM